MMDMFASQPPPASPVLTWGSGAGHIFTSGLWRSLSQLSYGSGQSHGYFTGGSLCSVSAFFPLPNSWVMVSSILSELEDLESTCCFLSLLKVLVAIY